MGALAAGDVTYTMLKQRRLGDSRVFNQVQIAVGSGTETYSTGGIPITKAKLGCPNVVESLIVVDKGGSAYLYEYDIANEKLILFQAPAQTHTHDIKIIESVTADATVGLNGATLGKNTASNATIAGANSTTLGGVVSTTLAAAGFTEVPNGTDIATQTIKVEVVGW